MAMHETVDASFVHDLLDEMGVTSTACGGEGDAEVRLNAHERIRQAKRRLAADRADREERARPIDAEWLESIGFTNSGPWMSIRVGPVELTWERVSGLWVDVARPLSAVKTRGQLLDLLRVLKGGAE